MWRIKKTPQPVCFIAYKRFPLKHVQQGVRKYKSSGHFIPCVYELVRYTSGYKMFLGLKLQKQMIAIDKEMDSLNPPVQLSNHTGMN